MCLNYSTSGLDARSFACLLVEGGEQETYAKNFKQFTMSVKLKKVLQDFLRRVFGQLARAKNEIRIKSFSPGKF